MHRQELIPVCRVTDAPFRGLRAHFFFARLGIHVELRWITQFSKQLGGISARGFLAVVKDPGGVKKIPLMDDMRLLPRGIDLSGFQNLTGLKNKR